MKIHTTFDTWPPQLRISRGLLNGKRVQMARESRGMNRSTLARKLDMRTVDLVQLEWNWGFWQAATQEKLLRATDYPIAFFVQDDPPMFDAPIFYCGTDEEGEAHCHVEQGKRP